jgi:hypothetical protein
MSAGRFTLAIALATAFLWVSPAHGQIAPGDTGAGVQRGVAEQNNSGQVGTVTLFRHGPSATLVILELHSEPPGRSEPAHIHRGKSCATLDPKPTFGLAPVTSGTSRTIVLAPEDKLLSGNYVVNVHSSLTHLEHYVACGELYRS